jgi:hypothetical protein
MKYIFFADNAEQMREDIVKFLQERSAKISSQLNTTSKPMAQRAIRAMASEVNSLAQDISAAFIRPQKENPFAKEEK